jgi:hypothetical protein
MEKNKERNAQHLEVSFWSFWWQRRFINFFKPTNSNSKTCKKSNIVNVHCLNKFLFVFPIGTEKTKKGMLNILKFLFEVFDGKDDSSTFSNQPIPTQKLPKKVI